MPKFTGNKTCTENDHASGQFSIPQGFRAGHIGRFLKALNGRDQGAGPHCYEDPLCGHLHLPDTNRFISRETGLPLVNIQVGVGVKLFYEVIGEDFHAIGDTADQSVKMDPEIL